jgi:histidinol-phosphate aminotransferase
VLRTFSKIYGLAGFRVGWAVAPPDVAAACTKVKNAFDVTQSAQDAAVASLGHDDELARRRDATHAARAGLVDGLAALGRAPLPAVANFVSIAVGDGAAVAAALEREGVIVRPLAGFGDATSIRVTVGTPDENRIFLEALARVL